MKKVTLILIALVFFNALNLKAQYLEPNKSIYEISDKQFRYYSKVRNKLFYNLSDRPEIRLLVKPSFLPEFVFQIEKDNTNGVYTAKYNVVSENIWYSKNYDSISVDKYSSNINKEDVLLLANVYLKTIEKTHFPIGFSGGYDGVTYHMAVWSTGAKSGAIWSPDTGFAKAIIDITEGLIGQIKKNKRNVALTKSNRIELEKILTELSHEFTVEDYKLALQIKEMIDDKKDYYSSQLSEDHKSHFLEQISNFERAVRVLLAYNGLNKNAIESLIDKYQSLFEMRLSYDLYEEDTNTSQEYIKKHSEDNIFMYIKSNIKYS